MDGQDRKTLADSVIAAAQQAVSTLDGSQGKRADHLHKLNELFVVVERRYAAMQDDLRARDAQIQILEETNDALTSALRTLTDRLQDSIHALETDDSELTQALERSEALVSRTFGTGGNANPTRPPDAPPDATAAQADEPDGPAAGANPDDPMPGDGGDELEDLELGQGDAPTPAEWEGDTDANAAPAGTDADTERADDVLVFEEAPADPDDDPETVALDPGPDPAAVTESELALVADAAGDADDSALPPEANGDAAPEADRTPDLAWTEAWSVGAAEMDRDHRVLINLINELPQAFEDPESDWVVGNVLNGLWDYTAYHFEREEALLRAANFPGAEEHARRHAVLKAQVRDWLDRYQRDPTAVDARALQTFLKGWLMNHVLGEDTRYRPYVENNPDAQAVAAGMAADPALLDSLGAAALPLEESRPDGA